MNKHVVFAGAIPLLLVLGACGSGEPSAPGEPSVPTAPPKLTDLDTRTQTIVKWAEDGTQSVTMRQVTREELLAARAARVAARSGARWPDSLTQGCSNNFTLLDDSTDFTGNEICFYNGGSSPDYASLGSYCENFRFGHCYGDWSGASIHSWEASGRAAASLTNTTGGACGNFHSTCGETANLPAGYDACNQSAMGDGGACDGHSCNYCSPSLSSMLGMNYLWINTSATSLCCVTGINCCSILKG